MDTEKKNIDGLVRRRNKATERSKEAVVKNKKEDWRETHKGESGSENKTIFAGKGRHIDGLLLGRKRAAVIRRKSSKQEEDNVIVERSGQKEKQKIKKKRVRFNKQRLTIFFRFFIYKFYLAMIAVILLYLFLAVLLLKFDFKNKFFVEAAKIIPVPAVLTNIGFIDFYNYQELASSLNKSDNEAGFREVMRKRIVEKILLDKLAKKYNIQFSGQEVFDKKDLLSQEIIYDAFINKVAFSRIEKISRIIEEGGDFETIGRKYGDYTKNINELSQTEYSALKDELEKLDMDQVSSVLISKEGYYLVKKDSSKMTYIFVGAITLEQYLETEAEKIKIWFLVR